MNNRVNKFMRIAKRLSYKGISKFKIGCVIAEGNEIIGLGFNNNKTHPRSNSKFQTIHSELSAILNSRREDLTGCTIYLYREGKKGQPMIAKPCNYCRALLKQVGIKEVFFTDTIEGIKNEVL